jgi:hypothetical protein
VMSSQISFPLISLFFANGGYSNYTKDNKSIKGDALGHIGHF